MTSVLAFLIGALYGAGCVRSLVVAYEFATYEQIRFGFLAYVGISLLWPAFLLFFFLFVGIVSAVGKIRWWGRDK